MNGDITLAALCHCQLNVITVHYPRNVVSALSVYVTATGLAGCPSHAGIVSKRLNLSENFFDHHQFLLTLRRYLIPRGNPSLGALNTREWGKLAIFDGNRNNFR